MALITATASPVGQDCVGSGQGGASRQFGEQPLDGVASCFCRDVQEGQEKEECFRRAFSVLQEEVARRVPAAPPAAVDGLDCTHLPPPPRFSCLTSHPPGPEADADCACSLAWPQEFDRCRECVLHHRGR